MCFLVVAVVVDDFVSVPVEDEERCVVLEVE